MRNSTIKIKFGICDLCNNNKEVALIKGMCASHYWLGVRMKSTNKQSSKDDNDDDPDVATLKNDLDLIFSRWLRRSGADKNGFCKCFICGKSQHYKCAEAGHYIKRGNSFLRYDARNVKINCHKCNQVLDGNYALYTKKLEEENPGITSILIEEGNVVYKFTRQELKDMISDYSNKLKQL